jgi:hypothetical protein
MVLSFFISLNLAWCIFVLFSFFTTFAYDSAKPHVEMAY